jgi:hypothetical protein
MLPTHKRYKKSIFGASPSIAKYFATINLLERRKSGS